MQRSTDIAVSNVKRHSASLKPKYDQTREWAKEILEDQAYLLDTWKTSGALFTSVTVRAQLGQCVNVHVSPRERPKTSKDDVTLADLIHVDSINHAAQVAEEKYAHFSAKVTEMVTICSDIDARAGKITDSIHPSTTLSDSEMISRANHLMEEVEVLTKKMDADCRTIASLPDTPKSLTQASRTAHLHDNTFMASLVQTSEEMNTLFYQVLELRNNTAQICLQHLQQISLVESSISSIHSKLSRLDVDEETARTFDDLNIAVRLPFNYGSAMIECIRRNEWAEKITAANTADETAIKDAEETKRRYKWAKDIGTAINTSLFDALTGGVETTPDSSRERQLRLTRQDAQFFVESLEKAGSFKDIVIGLNDLLGTLDTGSRSQVKKLKPFKNGSVHEASVRGGSLFLPGDETALRSLKSDKAMAEERLKSAESRIRKLEDLLHRQSQLSRPPSVSGLAISGIPSFERHSTSPTFNLTSALSRARESEPIPSSPSRRVSFNQDAESKTLAQRVVSLEAELVTQKGHSKELEKVAAAKSNAEDMLKVQVLEAISTKEDLLSNFEAHQREFDDERRLLNDENKKLKLKLEELDEELDRICGSHEHEYRIQVLEEDLDAARKEAAGEIQKAHESTESVRQKCLLERQRSEQIERDMQVLRAENDRVQSAANERAAELKRRDRSTIDHQSVLLSALLRISQEADAPDDFGTLVHALATAIENHVSEQMNFERATQTLKADHADLLEKHTAQAENTRELHQEILQQEIHGRSLRAELEEENSHRQRSESELSTLRIERDGLIARLAGLGSESEDLRAQVTDKSLDIEKLTNKIGEIESGTQTLQTKLEEKRSELASLQGSYVRLDSARQAQRELVAETSRLLFFRTSKAQRLLEQLGFNVSKQDGTMVLQRASKMAASGSINLADPSSSMKRSISIPPLTNQEIESSIEPNIFHWWMAENFDEMSRRHRDFSESIKAFDMDIFIEAIYKRVKEVEHIARKSQRDARAYRDKAHRAQGEAHDRLTLRNFKEGDLALFLPTRDQATKPWAAFNVGAPHYFLREQDSHKLSKRDWLIARISKVEERVVDLSRSMNSVKSGAKSQGEINVSFEDENPYELSDGLRWYLLDAAEEKPGAPINVGLGKTTVASVNVDAKGTLRVKKASDGNGATKTLTRSLDSRRSSSNSKKGMGAVASNSPNLLENAIDASSLHVDPSGQEQDAQGQEDTQDHPRPEEEQVEHVRKSKDPPSPPEW